MKENIQRGATPNQLVLHLHTTEKRVTLGEYHLTNFAGLTLHSRWIYGGKIFTVLDM